MSMAVRVHPFPSRTRQLSSLAPTILGWKRPGKIGRRQLCEALLRLKPRTKVLGFFFFLSFSLTFVWNRAWLPCPLFIGIRSRSLYPTLGRRGCAIRKRTGLSRGAACKLIVVRSRCLLSGFGGSYATYVNNVFYAETQSSSQSHPI